MLLRVAGSLSAPPPRLEQVENLTMADVTGVVLAGTDRWQRRQFRVLVGALAVAMVLLWGAFA